VLAIDPAGSVPFFSQLPAIDMLGLNDRHIGSHAAADFGEGLVGHERGDGDYVLRRRPDLVLFCQPRGGLGACYRSGREMVHDPRFVASYRPIVITSQRPALRSLIFVNVESPRIGIAHASDDVVVPGYLFADGDRAVAELDPATGRLGLTPPAHARHGCCGSVSSTPVRGRATRAAKGER
jgi:hypothetical protein